MHLVLPSGEGLVKTGRARSLLWKQVLAEIRKLGKYPDLQLKTKNSLEIDVDVVLQYATSAARDLVVVIYAIYTLFQLRTHALGHACTRVQKLNVYNSTSEFLKWLFS